MPAWVMGFGFHAMLVWPSLYRGRWLDQIWHELLSFISFNQELLLFIFFNQESLPFILFLVKVLYLREEKRMCGSVHGIKSGRIINLSWTWAEQTQR